MNVDIFCLYRMLLLILYICIFFTPIILYAIWKVKKINTYWSKQGILDVKPLPFIGNMWCFIREKHFGEWLNEMYNKYDARYFGIYSYMSPILFVKDVNLLKQMLIKDFDTFVDHNNFFTESKEPVLKENLFNLKGEAWRHMRVTLSPTFTGRKMRTMFNLISDCAIDYCVYYKSELKTNKKMGLNMKDFFTRFLNDTVATCSFGISCDSIRNKENEFFIRGKDVSYFGGIRGFKFLLYCICPNVMNFLKVRLYSPELINFFKNIVTSTIENREKGKIYRADMIQLLMEARKGKLQYEEEENTKETGFATAEESSYGKDNSGIKAKNLTDDEFAGQIFVFLLAGIETSSTNLSFLCYELAINEDIQRKLQAEIDEYMKECNEKVTYEGVLKLKYLDMVITESLRLWPPIFFVSRSCSKDYTIEPTQADEKPLHLKAGDTIWVPLYSIQRDEKFYSNPNKFYPERFSDDNKDNINKYSFLSFGIGPRNCIGSRFALLQMKLIVTYLFYNFNLTVFKETCIPPRIDKKQQLLATVDGINLSLELRKK